MGNCVHASIQIQLYLMINGLRRDASKIKVINPIIELVLSLDHFFFEHSYDLLRLIENRTAEKGLLNRANNNCCYSAVSIRRKEMMVVVVTLGYKLRFPISWSKMTKHEKKLEGLLLRPKEKRAELLL